MAIDDLMTLVPAELPPARVKDLASVTDPPVRLAIFGTTLNLARLAEFKSLEALWVSNINEKQFADLLPHLNVPYLNVEGVRVADLSPLGALSRLRALVIDWNTKVTDISFLSNLTDLGLLYLVHCTKVHDISAIASLTKLEILQLAGGMWSDFKPVTLDPLQHLKNLRGLLLVSIRVADQSLAALQGLTQLEELMLNNRFPTEEYARLSVCLPNTKCDHFAPYIGKIGEDGIGRVMVVGKGKPFLHLPDDAARLERYMQQFRALQEKFRSAP